MNITKKQTITLSIGLSLALTSGCDSIADQQYQGEPLASIRGKVKVPEGQLLSYESPRAVLIWQNPLLVSADGSPPIEGFERIAEDVAVVSQFPAEFNIDIFTPPPEAAIKKGIGIGQVYLYDDQNQNGKLDLVGPGETPIDKIIGTSEEALVFSKGTDEYNPLALIHAALCPSKEAPTPKKGFSLVRVNSVDFSFDDDNSKDPGCWGEAVILDNSEPLVAQLDNEASQSSQCLFEGGFNTTINTEVDVFTEDLPELSDYDYLSCEDLTVVYTKQTQEHLCDPFDMQVDAFSPVSPTPADWPCPIVVNN